MNVLVNHPFDPPIQEPEPFSVSATASLQERRYHTIKSGDTFGVFDLGGDIISVPGSTDGLYHQDTRHLSRFDLALAGMRPLLLSSSLGTDNVLITSDLSNASPCDLGAPSLEQGVIHVQRSLFLDEDTCHGRLAIRNFSFTRQEVRLDLSFEADFADLFEVRGMRRNQRGKLLPAMLGDGSITLSYQGLDGLKRATCLAFEPEPRTLTANKAVFDVELEPRGRTTIFFSVICAPKTKPLHRPRAAFLAGYVNTKRRLRASAARAAVISSRHEEFDEIMRHELP